MKLKEKLAAKLGREPSPAELETARRQRDEKRAAQLPSFLAAGEHDVARVDMVLIAKGNKADAGKFYLVGGATSTRPTLISVRRGCPVTTLAELYGRATRTFSSTAAGWQLHLGSSASMPNDPADPLVGNLVFVGAEDDWKEQFLLESSRARQERTTIDMVIFARELLDKAQQSVAGDPKPAASVAADLKLQATPVELRHAARTTGSKATSTDSGAAKKAASGGSAAKRASSSAATSSKKGAAKGKGKAAGFGNGLGHADGESDSDENLEELVKEVEAEEPDEGELLRRHMVTQLTQLETKLAEETKYDGMVLTTKVTGADGMYVPFSPKALTVEMIDAETGALKQNCVFFGCTRASCRGPLGTTEAPAFAVAMMSGDRAFAKDGAARLKSVAATLKKHVEDPVHLGLHGPTVGKVLSSVAAQEKSLGDVKKAFAQAAAMVQVTVQATQSEGASSSAGGEAGASGGSAKGLAAAEAAASNPFILTLPFDTPTKANFDTTLTRGQLDMANKRGEDASEDIVEVLRYFEFEMLLNGFAPEERAKVEQRAVYLKADDWKLLHRTVAMPAEEKAAALKRLQERLKIDCNLVDLVFCPIFPPSAGGHFGGTFWMPALFKGIHIDSYSPYNLYQLSCSANKPFIAHCTKKPIKDVVLLPKDESNGIEQQLSGSNVCAFTTTMFLQKALSKLKELYQKDGGLAEDKESRVALQTALFKYLEELNTQASTYQKRRTHACRDLTELIGRYAAHRKRKASETGRTQGGKAKAVVSLSEGDEDSDSPEDPPGSVFPCFCVLEGRASPCFCVSVFPCFRVSVFPCFRVSRDPPETSHGADLLTS